MVLALTQPYILGQIGRTAEKGNYYLDILPFSSLELLITLFSSSPFYPHKKQQPCEVSLGEYIWVVQRQPVIFHGRAVDLLLGLPESSLMFWPQHRTGSSVCTMEMPHGLFQVLGEYVITVPLEAELYPFKSTDFNKFILVQLSVQESTVGLSKKFQQSISTEAHEWM